MATTQTNVQQLIQGLAPGAVNNGNPNTVYNSPATPMQPANPAGLPPMADGFGNWFQNGLPQAASLDGLTAPTQSHTISLPQPRTAASFGSWTPPAPVGAPNLPVWNMVPTDQPDGGWGTPPPTTPPTGNPNLPPTGGPNPPAVSGTGTGGTGHNPTRGPGGSTGIINMGGEFDRSLTIYDPRFQEVWGSTKGTGNVDESKLGEIVQKVQKAGKWGELVDPNTGKLDWAQLIDMVTEPWFQTNMYLSGLNQWDTSNILAGLAQAVTGLPINQIMSHFGEQQALQNDEKNWLEKLLADHYVDNLRNQLAVSDTKSANEALAEMAKRKGMSVAELLARLGIDPSVINSSARKPVGSAGNEGCVTLQSHIEGFGLAKDVKVGDTLTVIDPVTFERSEATVSYSEAKLQPTVRIVTKRGIVLECSKSAPIADELGNEIRAENLLGTVIPIVIENNYDFDTVMKVEDLGDQMVQHITCENNFFLAGKEKGEYLLHHNAKVSQQEQFLTAGGGSGAGFSWTGEQDMSGDGAGWWNAYGAGMGPGQGPSWGY